MQQNETAQNKAVNEDRMVAEAMAAQAAIFVSIKQEGGQDMFSAQAIVKAGAPGIVQNFLAAVHEERDLLLNLAAGNITDADRYRVLREFAALASTNPKRFEVVNQALQAYEEQYNVDLAKASDEATYDSYVAFLCGVMAETDPEFIAAQQAREQFAKLLGVAH